MEFHHQEEECIVERYPFCSQSLFIVPHSIGKLVEDELAPVQASNLIDFLHFFRKDLLQ